MLHAGGPTMQLFARRSHSVQLIDGAEGAFFPAPPTTAEITDPAMEERKDTSRSPPENSVP